MDFLSSIDTESVVEVVISIISLRWLEEECSTLLVVLVKTLLVPSLVRATFLVCTSFSDDSCAQVVVTDLLSSTANDLLLEFAICAISLRFTDPPVSFLIEFMPTLVYTVCDIDFDLIAIGDAIYDEAAFSNLGTICTGGGGGGTGGGEVEAEDPMGSTSIVGGGSHTLGATVKESFFFDVIRSI